MFIRFWNWLTKIPVEKLCESCVTLRQELEYTRYQNQQLLNTIIQINSPRSVEETVSDEKPITLPNTRFQSFQTKRRELEAQSRVEASRLDQLKKDNAGTSDKVEGIQELEEMIGLK